jgi:hypothetical protein
MVGSENISIGPRHRQSQLSLQVLSKIFTNNMNMSNLIDSFMLINICFGEYCGTCHLKTNEDISKICCS